METKILIIFLITDYKYFVSSKTDLMVFIQQLSLALLINPLMNLLNLSCWLVVIAFFLFLQPSC